MFLLADLELNIRIRPDKFQQNILLAIREQINRKLANKVLHEVGLCIALKDILHVGESLLLPGDGASHTLVSFRYIVFRPNNDCVITGKIRSCNREGVYVTLGFFDDIFIPADLLQYPSRFEEAEQAWVWQYPVSENDYHDLYMDIGDPIKFRVKEEIFEEIPPLAHLQNNEVKTPYRIIGTVNEPGLGVLAWWEFPEEENEDEEEFDGDEDEDEDQDGECGEEGGENDAEGEDDEENIEDDADAQEDVNSQQEEVIKEYPGESEDIEDENSHVSDHDELAYDNGELLAEDDDQLDDDD